ncbi:hypothetical protein Lalb_Chr03g0040171 [Lupinus albus]|uniref:Uncharacterized protein n=1 Tax=Lupinus albus TaxID=3870 RepID=A0A6A4QUV0_LUPAL|nr:hypothetical protein Lalb_Chr03g0040171 [Lupinus albus]
MTFLLAEETLDIALVSFTSLVRFGHTTPRSKLLLWFKIFLPLPFRGVSDHHDSSRFMFRDIFTLIINQLIEHLMQITIHFVHIEINNKLRK